jgi:3-hydroxybutyryl-CoA dehydrogenase
MNTLAMSGLAQFLCKTYMKRIERIAIIGAGLMGHGIAQVFLRYPEYEITLYDTIRSILDAAPGKIRTNVQSMGGTCCDLSRLRLTDSLRDAVSSADIVIEAIPEKLGLKQQFFAEVERLSGPDCIFASNTSVIPITAIGEKLANKTRMIGTHWWNPPYLIPLVEVVQTVHTSPDVIDACMNLLAAVGKTPVHVKKDVPGFVANRLQHALWREAIAIVEAEICDAATVDLCIKNSFGLRLSVLAPLENADLVGLELTEDIHRVILPDLSAAKEPSSLLRQMINENRKGWSTGAGFYEWTEESKAELRQRLIARLLQLLPQPAAEAPH